MLRHGGRMSGPREGTNRDRLPARVRSHSSSLRRHGTPALFRRAKNAVSDCAILEGFGKISNPPRPVVANPLQ